LTDAWVCRIKLLIQYRSSERIFDGRKVLNPPNPSRNIRQVFVEAREDNKWSGDYGDQRGYCSRVNHHASDEKAKRASAKPKKVLNEEEREKLLWSAAEPRKPVYDH
jgi:hypothetical protein